MLEDIRGFLRVPFNRHLLLALLLLGAAIFISESGADGAEGDDARLEMHYFFSPSCPHCAQQKAFNAQLAQDFPQLDIISHDVTIPGEVRLLQMMAQNHSIPLSRLGTPVSFIGQYAIVGYQGENTTGEDIRSAIGATLTGEALPEQEAPSSVGELTGSIDLPLMGPTDLSGFSLPLLAAVLGLIDGFNPCAMWVLVYLIALMMGFGDRRRMLLVVGLFVLSSGILYFLFMTAWLNVFLFLSFFRPVTIIVGLIALGGGIISVREYIQTKGAPVCKVTDAEGRKRMMADMRELLSAPLTWATLLGIIILAFTVNSIEFLCSFALPALFTQVLALSDLSSLEYYAYILLYDIFFMLDDMLVFGLAAWTITGVSGEKYSRYCKVIGAAIMLVLGLMLLFAPDLLA